jgi:hypothetical protein
MCGTAVIGLPWREKRPFSLAMQRMPSSFGWATTSTSRVPAVVLLGQHRLEEVRAADVASIVR